MASRVLGLERREGGTSGVTPVVSSPLTPRVEEPAISLFPEMDDRDPLSLEMEESREWRPQHLDRDSADERKAGSGARNTWTVTVLTRDCRSTGRRRHIPVGRLTRRWVSATTPFLQGTWKVVATAIRRRLFIPSTSPLYHRPRPCTMCCGGGGAHGHVP